MLRALRIGFLLTGMAGVAVPVSLSAAALGAADARHLLNRTGFEANAVRIAEFARLSRGEALERLLAEAVTVAQSPPPASADAFVPFRRLGDLSVEERKAFQREQIERAVDLKNWWIGEMLRTPSPLAERMTLFWHNHFTSSLQKVRSSALMFRQNALLRRHALGNFGALLHAVAKDPAMLVYLDSATSRRGKPNENFAREAMELFTLGEGNYSEDDIREAARAFTGWSIDRDTGDFRWRPFAHDGGTKTVLGRRGDFDGEQVLDILLAQPQTAEFIVAKLWREFVSPDPDPTQTRRIAQRFRQSGYDIRTALRELLNSDAFYASANRGSLVKSPVDLVIGTVRQFDVAYSDPLPLMVTLRNLGQDLFSPPNVRGWPGGNAWIDSSTLLSRRQFLERLFRVDEAHMRGAVGMGEMQLAELKGTPRLADGRARFMRAALDIRFSGSQWLRQFPAQAEPESVLKVLLALPPASGEPMDARGVELIRRITADPAYQLK